MKTMKKFLSMAALALVGAMMTGCSSDDDILQPENKSNVVTLTATVGFDDGVAATRAVTGTGVKTFGDGDQMAVIYKNTSGGTVKAVGTLASGAGTKSGTFTFTLTNPDKTQNVTYIYPAAMAGSTGVDYTKLNSQSSGTLTDLGSKYDLTTNSGAWVGGNLPSLTLVNQLAILAINLKNSTGASDITGDITGMTISDGTNTYTVSRSATAGPIYVAIRPTTSATIDITATDGSKNYAKTLATTKTYEAGNGYSVSWKMAKVVDYSSEINVPAGDHWYIGGSSEYNNITIGEGATVTIGSFLQMQYASIICSGNATIILADGTTTNIFNGRIKAGPEGTTLTIKGNTGELNINPGSVMGAAIGASDDACGNIVIEGGIITATGVQDAGIGASSNAKCGNITISGGTVTATGSNGAGIGASNAECGDITISGGTVTATGGTMAAGIGSGSSDTGWCGNITISGGTVTATGGTMAAGIGTGAENGCGDITIKSTVTHVTATKGSYAEASIGAAIDGDSECGTVTIEDPSKVTQN